MPPKKIYANCDSCGSKIEGYPPFYQEDDDNLYCDNCWDELQAENRADYAEPTEADEWHSFDPDC